MKTFVICSLIVVIAVSSALAQNPNVYVPFWNQFQPQDILDQYAYGYNAGLSTKNEVKLYDGTTRRGYTYVDANGELQSIVIGTPEVEKQPEIEKIGAIEKAKTRLDEKAFTRHYKDDLHKPIADAKEKDQASDARRENQDDIQVRDVYAEYIPVVGYQYNPSNFVGYKTWAYATN